MFAGTLLSAGYLVLNVRHRLEVLYGFVRLYIKHLVILRKVKFYRKMWLKKDLLHDVFSVYMLDGCMSDDCLMSVFLPLNVAVQTVYDNFKQYVFS